MKVNIEGGEWYPVYGVTAREDTAWGTLEVPGGTVKRWRRITAEFATVQEEISALLDDRDKTAKKSTPR